MADKKARQAQKKREKQKKKRQNASRSRAARQPVAAPTTGRSRADLSEAVQWPVGDCYLSSTWHEHGPVVQAGFVREHANGRAAAVFFTADLRDGGVTDVQAAADVSADGITGEMARRSELSGDTMMVAEADLVAKVFHTAAGMVDAPVENGQQALTLFAGIDGSTCTYELLTGDPPPPPAKKQSLFGWLFG